jgi:hypothetical protein
MVARAKQATIRGADHSDLPRKPPSGDICCSQRVLGIICYMDRASDQSPPVTSLEFPEEPAGRLGGVKGNAAGSPTDLALQSTEAALGHVTKVVIENIRQGGDVSPHIEAAERDLRDALRQLGLAKRHPHDLGSFDSMGHAPSPDVEQER